MLSLAVVCEAEPDRHTGCHLADRVVVEGERRKGLEQARGAARIGVPIVLGVARTKRECWVLAGFQPRDEQEKRLLQEVRQGLGFNPCEHPERLTAHGTPGAKRDAKQVLDELTAAAHARQEACWRESDLAVLKDRGRGCGLAEYLDEVRGHLVPLFTARGSRSQ